MNKFVILLSICCVYISCGDKSSKKSTTKNAIIQTQQTTVIDNPIELEVILDKVRIRDKAGLDGTELEQLKKGTKVTFMGEISDFTDKIKLRGIQYNDPWLKIQIRKGQEGWIYGGAVKFKSDEAGKELKNRLITKRLEQFFGSKIVYEVEAYQKQFEDTKTEKEFPLLYRSNKELGHKMNYKFTAFFEMGIDDSEYPDLFWIDDPIPAMSLSLVAEGTQYQIFTNIDDLYKKAAATEGKLDDEFAKIIKAMHDNDIEYYYPVWFLQTWDYGGYSLLGQGKHTAILNRLEKLAIKTDLFNPEIRDIKKQVIQDIIEGEHYGEKSETILKELDTIINSKYTILTESDLTVLKNRRPMFEEPEKHKINVFEKDY
ncbi:MAG: SH3 domain-containing protein [Saprospiraceae bacterium]